MIFEFFTLTTHESFVTIAYIICVLVLVVLITSIQRDGTQLRRKLSELKALELISDQDSEKSPDGN